MPQPAPQRTPARPAVDHDYLPRQAKPAEGEAVLLKPEKVPALEFRPYRLQFGIDRPKTGKIETTVDLCLQKVVASPRRGVRNLRDRRLSGAGYRECANQKEQPHFFLFAFCFSLSMLNFRLTAARTRAFSSGVPFPLTLESALSACDLS